MLGAGGLFFTVAVMVSNQLLPLDSDAPSLNIAAYAGALAVLVSKSAKYAVFDATKEMVFIVSGICVFVFLWGQSCSILVF
jgi:ATP/ADP translocase